MGRGGLALVLSLLSSGYEDFTVFDGMDLNDLARKNKL